MWYTQLGFHKYPLDPRSNPNLIGVQAIEQQLIGYIEQGNMCLLCGFTGSGKTSMLQRVSKNPQLSKYKFLFISADGIKKSYDIEDAIKDSTSLIDLLMFKKPKNIVVLLDESHLANRVLTESIKSKWNHIYSDGSKTIQSVVISQIEPQLGTNFSGSFIDRLGHRVIQMRRLNTDELIQVLRSRLDNGKQNYADRFDDEGMQLLVTSSDGSVRQLLEYTDAIFRKMASFSPNPLMNESFKIDKPAVFNILQECGLVVQEKGVDRGHFAKLLENKRYKTAVEMFEQFGTINAVILAEKLDVSKQTSQKVISELVESDALVLSHEEDGEEYFCLTPRLRHQLTKA